MDSRVGQNLQAKLKRRVQQAKSSDYQLLASSLKRLINFIETEPACSGAIDTLLKRFSSLDPQKDIRKWSKAELRGSTFEQAAAISFILLKKASLNINDADMASHVLFGPSASNNNERIRPFKEEFLCTLSDYLEEAIDEQQLTIHLLLSFKQRSEWFNSQQLRELVNSDSDSRKVEALLAQRLYLYLYDAGIDITIEPSSPRGRIDLIAAQKNSDNKLLADAKVFDAGGRGKRYLLKGFRQIYSYCQQYNENFGYLIIFKLTDKDLDLAITEEASDLPSITYNNKTISFLTIDIHQYKKPVSQREPLQAVTITREDLIKIIEEKEEE